MTNIAGNKKIPLLTDVRLTTPVVREYYKNWSIKAFTQQRAETTAHMSPNRRDYYKVMLITQASGIFTMGLNTYQIDSPTILFIPPADIISWQGFASGSEAHYCLFKRKFVDSHSNLKGVMDKYGLFTAGKGVIKVPAEAVQRLADLFVKIQEEDKPGDIFAEDAIQAYLQLIMIAAAKMTTYTNPGKLNDDYRHIHQFFNLLEVEAADVNYVQPIKMKTAKEFAESIAITPNYLNTLLKKYTGQNVSAHIKNRILDESKALLLQTDWTLQDIGYALGFADQPNFSSFFKKYAGITPATFRRQQYS
ncbi:AraC family transcriptional regulator [Mucilaginibacter sp. SMC90]|uniref:AraC family transcriptional regulator n=1 Tax=Mucilaginibacter sp. SMC90 TaxID=2929803 RepID=UPI001FB4E421|nr:helix-turn-helix domain-containing protein [Mucilaginibacter sp. SMC90]UOE47958.1 AraC family transcriptional regulator [Mucilaginibacter sp. SMC90]